MTKFTAVSLFAGAGGLDMGFERAGFKIIWANDFDRDACKTHQSWSSAEVVCGDIAKVDMSQIPVSDVILGGFPCQGFSLSGPRKIDDSRNVLYRYYVKLVKQNQPKAFVGENVKGLLTMGGGQIIDAIINDFSECGYDVYYKLVNAKNFGVPQDRERVIIVGFRKDLGVESFNLPDGNGEHMTMREAFKGLPPAKPEEVCSAPYSSRYMSRNRKRDWDDISYTIPAMAKQVTLWPGSPDMVKLDKDDWTFGPDGETRRLSWREAAAVQTFPADMEFAGDLTSIYKQIGNAVPVKLAEFVGRQVKAILEQQDKVDDLLNQIEEMLVEEVVVFDAAPIQEQILEIGELATVAYRYTNVGTLDSTEHFKFLDWTVPFSKKTIVVSMDGVLKAGVDMAQVEIITDEATKTITIRLPKATILSNELDENSLVVYEEEDQLFSNITLEDSSSIRCQIKDKAEEKALEYDLLKEARTKAGDLIRNLIEAVPEVKDTYTIVVV